MKDTTRILFCAVALACLAIPVVGFGEAATADSGGSDAAGHESFSHWSPIPGGLSGQTGVKNDEGWLLIDGFFTPYKHMSGGGASVSGEWIPDWRIGLGGRVGMTFLSGKDAGFKIKSDTLNLDAHIPVKLTDWLVAYAGVELKAFDMEYSYTMPGTFRYQDGKGGYFSRNGNKITFESEKPSSVTSLYVGLRLILAENFFVFGEYHKDSGSITMTASNSYLRHGEETMKVDMDASLYVVGAGFMF